MRKRIISLLLVMSLFCSMTLIASAEENVYTQDSDVSNPAIVLVTANVESTYSVVIPKEIRLEEDENGDYTADYTVDIVNGNIDVDEYISVIPESEVTLRALGESDVILSIAQPVTKFRSSIYEGDLSAVTDTVLIDNTNTTPESTGSISVKEGFELSSGDWSGTLTFDISLTQDTPADDAESSNTNETT